MAIKRAGFTGPRGRLIVGVTVGVSASSLLRGQLSWLKAQGWDLLLVASPDDMAVEAAYQEGVGLAGVWMRRGISPVQDVRSFIRWISVLRSYRPEAINVGTPKAGLLGGVAAWITRVPTRVYTVRGLRLEGARGPLKSLLWLMEWVSMRVATDVIFVSRSLVTASQSAGLSTPNAWIINEGSSNGVPALAIAKRISLVNRDEHRKNIGVGRQDFVIGFIGRITKDKGVETLIRACTLLGDTAKQVRIVMVGNIEDPVYETQIGTLSSLITIRPWTSDVWSYLAAIDVLCLPTFREGFPNVVIEAAAAGVPAIVSRATGAVDSVIDGETGVLVDVGDAEGLAKAICDLAADREKTRRLGAAARERAISAFEPEKIWLGIDEVLRGTPGPKHAQRVKTSGRRVPVTDDDRDCGGI